VVRGGISSTTTKTVAKAKPVAKAKTKPVKKLKDLKSTPVQKQVDVPVVEEIMNDGFDPEVNDIVNEIRSTILD
jgi:hypothetical protein